MSDEVATIDGRAVPFEAIEQLVKTDCPGIEAETEHATGHHVETATLQDDGSVTFECRVCGEKFGTVESEEAFLDAKRDDDDMVEHDFCPACGEWSQLHQGAGERVNGEIWHRICWYTENYGFEETDTDEAPSSSNSGKPFNLHRAVETTIDGEVFSWDEYVFTGLYQDHGRYNLPTRDDLTPSQLETLREWENGDNPTGEPSEAEYDFDVGEFPARFVLIGNYENDAHEKWICPACGEVVEPKTDDFNIDINAECENCGSDKWLTHGKPIEESLPEAFQPLSDRERQVVMLDMLPQTNTDAEIADAFGVQPSTVREYRERAKAKANRGKELYDQLETAGVIDDE